MTRVSMRDVQFILSQILPMFRHIISPWAALISMVLLLSAMSSLAIDYVSAYPNAIIEISEKEQHQNHPVITNLIKKVNGVVDSDGSQWLIGELDRTLYQLPTGQTSMQGFDFYLREFEKSGVHARFQCRSFSCGSSNLWANNVFDIARLYGQDRHQAYYIGEKHGRFYSVYSIRHGNGRVYTLVDIFSPNGVANSRSSADFLENGYENIFINNQLFAKDKQFMNLQKYLKHRPSANVLLVIHGKAEGSIQDWKRQHQELMKKAEILRNTLLAEGITQGSFMVQINAVPARKWQPKATDDTLWIEVVMLK